MKNTFKILSGLIALLIYLVILFIIFYLFGSNSDMKSVHYVKANDNQVIKVSLGGPKLHISKDIKKPVNIKKKKSKPKKVRNITSSKPSPSKSKISKNPVKNIKAKSLFADVDTSKIKNRSKHTKKVKKQNKTASKEISNAIKKNNSKDAGIEHKYFAILEATLRGWPAQVNYAGELISVRLKIYSSGKFKFWIEKLSSNVEFNEALVVYLKQLQQIGLQKHNRARPYDVLVEFEAKQ